MAAHHLLGVGLDGRARLADDALYRMDDDGGGSPLVRAALHGALAAAHMLDRSLEGRSNMANSPSRRLATRPPEPTSI